MVAAQGGALALAGIGAVLGVPLLTWSAVPIILGWVVWDQRRDQKLRRARALEEASEDRGTT